MSHDPLPNNLEVRTTHVELRRVEESGKNATHPLATITIVFTFLISGFLVIWTVIHRDFSDAGRFTLIVLFSALMVSVILGVLSFSNAGVEFSFKQALFRASGPAALMAAVTIWMTRPDILAMVRADFDPKISSAIELNNVKSYSEWKRDATIGSAADIYNDENESFNLKNLFHFAYFHKGDPGKKIEKAKIETVLFYYVATNSTDKSQSRRYVKFQRISGQPSSNTTEMYYTATSGIAAGTPTFSLFSRESNGVVGYTNYALDSKRQPPDRYQRLGVSKSSAVDCMVVGFYPDGNDRHGDDFWVDVPNYSRLEARLLFYAFAPPNEFATNGDKSPVASMWKLHSGFKRGDTDSHQIPLQFEEVSSRPTMTFEVEQVKQFLAPWLKNLDDYLTDSGNQGEQAQQFLSSVLESIGSDLGVQNLTFADLLQNDKPWKPALTFPEERAQTPLCVVYSWAKGYGKGR